MGDHASRAPDGSTLTLWQCTTCGRRYLDPTPFGLFISPPPTTDCVMIQTDEKWTHAKGGIVNLSVTSGATCDYVRVNGVIDDQDEIAEPESAAAIVKTSNKNGVSAWSCITTALKEEGEHGRVSRHKEVANTAYNEEQDEDGEFWEGECSDVDCIHEGVHRRDQCAMAEWDEEPKAKVDAPAWRRGFRFMR